MAEITKISDHYQKAIERLPEQFRDKPNIDAILQTWFSAIQDIEDDLIDMREGIRLYEARGVNLDRYATTLGLTRDFEESDGSLFGRIATKILSRSSEGSTESLRRAVETVTGLDRTNIIEFNNIIEWENDSEPFLTGGVLVYGYYYSSSDIIHDVKSNVIEGACPATVDNVIFGKHLNDTGINNLWIPCEVVLEGDDLVFRDAADVIDNAVDGLGNQIVISAGNFKSFGEGWEQGILPEDDIRLDNLVVEPSGENLGIETELGGELLNMASSGLGNNGVLLEVYT